MESERRIRELEQRVAVLTEALQPFAWLGQELEPALLGPVEIAAVQRARAALAATAGTQAGREERVQKLEHVADLAREVVGDGTASYPHYWLMAALRDLDAEAFQQQGGGQQESTGSP